MYGRLSTRSGTSEQHVVRLEQVPRWIEQEPLSPSASHSESETSDRGFVDPLTSLAGTFFSFLALYSSKSSDYLSILESEFSSSLLRFE